MPGSEKPVSFIDQADRPDWLTAMPFKLHGYAAAGRRGRKASHPPSPLSPHTPLPHISSHHTPTPHHTLPGRNFGGGGGETSPHMHGEGEEHGMGIVAGKGREGKRKKRRRTRNLSMTL